jgi:tRNA(Ile)-lysidine synthase
MKGFTVLERVRKTITRYNMLPAGSRIAVAVSGGPDSVCLLHVLAGLAAEFNIRLSVAHFNHKLRGEESDGDERLAAALADSLHLPFHRAEGQVAAAKDNLEQAARRARRAFFAGLMQSHVDRVALGHTRDDQSETVLFRLLRGAGLTGLAGVYPLSADGYVRPLIDVTRADVEAFLRTHGLVWREDSSNRDPRFARNRIRRDLLPQLAREWNPRIGEALAHLADLAFEEERWWKSYLHEVAARWLKPVHGGVELPVDELARLPVAIQRRLVRGAIAEAKGDLRRITFGHIEQILELMARAQGNGRLRLPGAVEVRRSFDWLRIAPVERPAVPSPITVTIPGSYPTADGTQIHFELVSGRRRKTKDATLQVAELSLRRLPVAHLPVTVELRCWRPGDEYRPAGQSHGRRMKEMFQQARIPSWRRHNWPIVSSGSTVIWARRFGAAAKFSAGREEDPVVRIWEQE